MLSSAQRGMIGLLTHRETAMRTACVLLLVLSTAALADDKPVKWEYAQLSYRTNPARLGGKDTDDKEVPPAPPVLAIHWTTGSDDLTAMGWVELAEKLKATIKKDAGLDSQKIQVLNALGENGWELVDVQSPPAPAAAARTGAPGQPGGFVAPATRAGTTMLFKRRR
jgi:hypothetical protein